MKFRFTNFGSAKLAALAGLLGLFAAVSQAADTSRPNVIIIYGDDVGFADVGVNGSKMIPTPNIDRLAEGGLNFIDGHCPASTCSASRYAMLTGFLAHRKNVRIISPTSPMAITDEYTLPELFRDAGYATAVIGKWHLGLGQEGVKTDWNGAVKPGPLEIGFDYSFLLPNTNDRVPCVYLENHHVVNLDPNDPLFVMEKGDPRSTEYPDGRKNPETMTFYMNTHGHNHSVINGIGRIGVQYGGKSALWDDATMSDEFVMQTEKWMNSHMKKTPDQPFFLYFSSQDIHVPRVPHPRFRGATELGYRGDAMVQFDWTTGEIMKMLDKHGIADNTIVIFSSDNGPVYDDGYDDGTVVKTSTEEVDRGHDGSGPYRGGKYQIYEGGTRVPFIVRWPARIKPGTSQALVSHTDFMSSFAELLDMDLPEGTAPDSQSNLSALLGDDKQGAPYQIQEARGYALRHRDWKLTMPYQKWNKKQGPKPPQKFELFNLAEDIGEQNDISATNPERVESMKAVLLPIVDGASVRETFENASR